MNNTPPLTLAHRLRISREAADIGVSQMATILGVTRNTISRWEREGPHAPTLGALKTWAAETGASLSYLLGEETPPVVVVTPAQLERRRKAQPLRRGGSEVVTHLPTDRHARDYGLTGRAFHQVAA